MIITVGHLTDWILAHRNRRAFLSYTRAQIEEELTEAMMNGTLVYHAENGDIFGVACGRRDDDNKVIYIYDVLTTRPDIIQKFLARFLLVYPEYSIQGQRNGRLRVFESPERTLQILMNYGKRL